jgi:AsmA protein
VTFAFEAPGMLQGPIAGSADLRQTGQLMKINSVSGTIGTSKFSGWATVDFASGKPLVKLDLDVQRLDLAAITVTDQQREAATAAQAATDWDKPWSDARIDLDGLNFVDAEVQFSAGEFNIDKFKLAPVVLGATLDAGVLRVTVSRMGMHGGQVNGTIQIDASAAEPSHALQMSISGVRAYPLLSDVAQFSQIDGRMEANIDLRARGASQRAVMSSFAGTIAVTFQDGALRNFNVAQTVRDLGVGAIAGWQDSKTGGTEFTEINALFRVDAGRATTTNLRMLGPLVRVSGAGTADLGAKTLQFRLEPKLVLTLQGQGGAADPVGLGVPVVVQGTWGKPEIYPDIAGVLDNPGAAFAKIREMAPAIFGGGNAQSGGQSGGILQGLGGMLDRLGKDSGTPGSPPPAGQQGSGNFLREFFGR